MPQPEEGTPQQLAAPAATRERRLELQNVPQDQLTPEFRAARMREASGYDAAMATLASTKREQRTTHNESVGIAGKTAAPLKP